jgi:integral membrane protein (TIGR01906 family)
LKTGFRKVLGAIFGFAWMVFGVTLVIRWVAGDGGLLAAEMLRAAPPAVSGLAEKDYAGVGAMTAEYLTGKRAEFQYVAAEEDPNGACRRREVFQAHEAAHMADCRGLIALDGWVCAGSLAVCAACCAAGVFCGRARRLFLQGAGWGLAGFFGIAVVLGIWAAVDFDGLFVTFHRVAFPQGGWLLDPRTDLLIRLMPVSFFIRLGVTGLLRFGLFATVTVLGLRGLRVQGIGFRDFSG